jgi:hypothetical protein
VKDPLPLLHNEKRRAIPLVVLPGQVNLLLFFVEYLKSLGVTDILQVKLFDSVLQRTIIFNPPCILG